MSKRQAKWPVETQFQLRTDWSTVGPGLALADLPSRLVRSVAQANTRDQKDPVPHILFCQVSTAAALRPPGSYLCAHQAAERQCPLLVSFTHLRAHVQLFFLTF